MSKPTVELHQAFEWTCEECGRRNFASAVTLENPELEAPEHIDPEIFDGGDWLIAPTRVTCGHCGEEFDVEEAT